MSSQPMKPMEASESNLQTYWQILVRGRWLILGSFLLVVASTALFTFTTDPVYEAKAYLLVEQSNLSSAGELSQLLLNPLSLGTRNDLQNRIGVLLSIPVLERTQQKLLGTAEFVAIRRQWLSRSGLFGMRAQASNTSSQTAALIDNVLTDLLPIEDLKERVSAKPTPNTDIIEVTAQGNTSREAQLIADTLVQSYLEEETEHTKETITSVKDFLENQLGVTQSQLENSEEQAIDFQKKSGLELGVEGATQNLIQLKKAILDGQIQLDDKQGALDAVQRLLEDTNRELLNKESSSEDMESLLLELRNKVTTIRQIQSEITDLEQERSQAIQEQNFIKAQELQNEILQKKADLEQRGTEQFKILNLLPKYEELIQQQLRLTVEIEAVKHRINVAQATADVETQKMINNSLELLRLQRNLDVDKNIYILLREEYERARIAEAGEPGTVRLVQAAVEPEDPVKPNKKLNLILAAILGLTLGTGASFLRAYLDNTLKTSKDLEKVGLLPLGTLFEIQGKAKATSGEEPLRERLLSNFDAGSALFDAYMGLRTNLRFASMDQPLKTLVITSSLPGEGKTLTAINLALALASTGEKILLVDADLRNPSLSRLFDLADKHGFTELVLKEADLSKVLVTPYTQEKLRQLKPELLRKLLVKKLISPADWDAALKLQREDSSSRSIEQVLVQQGFLKKNELEKVISKHLQGLENLYILPSGAVPPSAASFLSSAKIDSVVEDLKKRFDLVLFDAPPVITLPDVALLGRRVDGVLMVIKAEETRVEAIRQAVEQLQMGNLRMIGGLLNRVKPQTLSYYPYYGGYGYGYGNEREKEISRD